MGLVSLLFSFQGRIGRLQYWLGNLALCLLAVFTFVLLSAPARQAFYLGKANPATMSALATTSLLAAPIWALISWSGYALQVKRFHDRGRTGYLVLIPVVLFFFLFYAVVITIAGGAKAPALIEAIIAPLGLLWLVNLWFFIDLGCLPSVEGPNKYTNPPGAAPSLPPPPQSPHGAASNRSATSTLFGAQTALEHAIGEPPRQRAVTTPTPAPASSPSFGRRPTQ